MNTKLNVVRGLLFGFAGVLAIFGIWSFVVSVQYIGTLLKQGQVDLGKNFFEVLKYIVDGSLNYLIYASLLATSALVIGLLNKQEAVIVESIEEDDEDDYDNEDDEDDEEDDAEVIEEAVIIEEEVLEEDETNSDDESIEVIIEDENEETAEETVDKQHEDVKA